jgi:EAL domain-containing protein (putative c-di-GMP-specific phosphodiesterase class I)
LYLPQIDAGVEASLKQLPDWTPAGTQQWDIRIGGSSRFQNVDDVVRFLEVFTHASVLSDATSHWKTGGDSIGCGHGCGTPPTAEASCDRVMLQDLAMQTRTPLRKLLQEGRIETLFQPVVLPDAETVWGYECLMRGIGDDGERIPPNQLLAWAKTENLLSMLDRVCRETHLRNAAAHIPGDKTILINFIPTAIYEPAFCLQSTLKVVRETDLDPSQIVFEVVESEHVRDSEHLCNILDFYREGGFRTALDDLGAGFSGLNMLASLKPDLLKLDLELVQGAAEQFVHRTIVQGLVNIAKECGQMILAEGIETEAQFELMRELGVDLFQGYYFGKPASQPVESLARC